MVRLPYLPGQETRISGLGLKGSSGSSGAVGAVLAQPQHALHQGHAAAPLLPTLPALLSIPISPSLPSSWPFPAMPRDAGRRAAIGALMHPCRNAWKPKAGAPFSLDGPAGKMSFPIHRGNSGELIWRPGITQTNSFLGVGVRLQLTRAVESGRALPRRTRL